MYIIILYIMTKLVSKISWLFEHIEMHVLDSIRVAIILYVCMLYTVGHLQCDWKQTVCVEHCRC